MANQEAYQIQQARAGRRIQRGYPDRKPGAARINPARIEIVRELVAVAAPDQRAAFEGAVARLTGPDGAKAVERMADSLTERFAKQDVDAPAIVR